MQEEKLYGVGFCKSGSITEMFKDRMDIAEYELNKTQVLLRREIRKNETLRKKLKKKQNKMILTNINK